MADRIKIVGLGGSLSATSSSLAALKVALAAAADGGAETELLDIRALDLPMYDPAVRAAPESVRQFADTVHSADGMLWASPLYHGTISGSFKNALDWLQVLSRREPPFVTDKVIGLICAAGGVQGLQAINTMEFVVRALRGWTVPLVVPVAKAWQVFDENGQSKDPAVAEQLQALGREVVRAAVQFSKHELTKPDAAKAEAEVEGE